MTVVYDGWRPQAVTTVETLDPTPVAALSALLDSGTSQPTSGDVLPPLWHWVALPRWPASSSLGPDGHPRRGNFLPPIDLPRRMFAGGEVTLHAADLRVGAQVRREALVEAVEEKQGRSGPLVVVRVRTRLHDDADRVLLEERQDLVYRDAPAPSAPTALPDPATAVTEPATRPLCAEDGGWRFTTDATLLMRFSAATANPHRIHYDWPYATRAEGYPGLVVQGPLSTLVLAEVLRLQHPDRVVRRLRHRNTAPLFCGEDAHVTVALADPHAEISLRRGDGTPVTGLSAQLAPANPKGTP